MSFPKQLNIGSGKDFREDFLNLDSNVYWEPDIICDINFPLPQGSSQTFDTTRFGEIEITKNMFEKIIAFDVLEHIPNLHICIKSCIDLLKEGGILEISVPYDLSLGAWQDPFHVRAFNENSWLYFTDWFWYMGWTEARFVKENLVLNLNQLGLQLQASDKDLQEIIRTPRAVDSMFIQLKKIALTIEDRQALQHFRGKPRG
jgi:SAM-dependent methyltransferase